MDFIRIKEDTIRLDMITRIREGQNNETFYGRSVRKGTESWLDIHFIGGEQLKLEGEAAMALRRYMEQVYQVQDITDLGLDDHPPKATNGHAPVRAAKS